jgi:hypothetical protein
VNFLKVTKATDLSGRDYYLYRFFEILPGFLSWFTLLALLALSYFNPMWVAIFLVIFDVYWLLLVLYLGVHLLASYKSLKTNLKIDWAQKCGQLQPRKVLVKNMNGSSQTVDLDWHDLIHLIIFPFYKEDYGVISASLHSIVNDGYSTKQMILVLATEERAGGQAQIDAQRAKQEFGKYFQEFVITTHPDGIAGEQAGKGANQAWAARVVRKEIIDAQGFDYHKILVSVMDMDTIVHPGYFHCFTYKFMTVENPYRASYQPVPIYNNNVWEAPFFSRIAAFSNTFWQMIQQMRVEKLATYSSHSMTWNALVDIDFWSVSMVSEDSRIFYHCFLHYNGEYRVEPLYYPIYMDSCMDKRVLSTARNLYKQQRRWGWGVENVPYFIFNTIKRWQAIPKSKFVSQILFVQLYGFHSWATNALIIGVIGWMPLLLGGDSFNVTVLSTNLPQVTRILMTMAMVGLIISAALSNMMLPKRPKGAPLYKSLVMVLQWVFLPISIVIFGSIPAIEAQTRLIFGKYMGFWVTPKERSMDKFLK